MSLSDPKSDPTLNGFDLDGAASDGPAAEQRALPEDGPWAIKLMAGVDRQAALDAAKRARVPVGEWLGRAIRAYIDSERAESSGYDVFSPGQQLALSAPHVPLTVGEIGQAVEIANRIADLRGAPLKPRSRLLTAASRALAEHLGVKRVRDHG